MQKTVLCCWSLEDSQDPVVFSAVLDRHAEDRQVPEGAAVVDSLQMQDCFQEHIFMSYLMMLINMLDVSKGQI